MSSNTFGENDLLEYNSKYKLLICRPCQYAIQKSALDSHLLRHKIYRGARQDLLSSISHLDLLDPEDVPLPTPASPPVSAIPVLSGFRCVLDDCHHLTVSFKRMRRHWSENHGLDGSVVVSTSLAQEVKLQTFFRGTKVRYFEVAASPNRESDFDAEDNDEQEKDKQNSEVQDHPNTSDAAPEFLNSTFDEASSAIPTALPSQPEVDLETLSYFHHFTTVTFMTLPELSIQQHTEDYWQVYVVPLALQRRWLMCGLLAVSAHHLAVMTKDAMVKRSHIEWMSKFSSDFFAELERTAGHTLDFESALVEAEPKQIGEQIRFLLQCAKWTLPRPSNEPEQVYHSKLSIFMSIIRNYAAPTSSINYTDVAVTGEEFEGHTFFSGLPPSKSSDIYQPQPDAQVNHTPSSVVDRLRMLPFRLAERIGRPESVNDVLATMTAVTALVKCCEAAFAHNEGSAIWRHAATWSTEVPDHFNQMLLHRHPAALVTLAHWATILVLKAEQAGAWFLRGLWEEIMLSVSTALSNSDVRVLDLTEDLAGLARH